MCSADLKELEKRIQKIEDIQAIKDLKARYGEACDDGYNLQKLKEIFTEDAVWDGGQDLGRHEGRKAIEQFFAGVAADVDMAVHYFTQPLIVIADDGQTAKATWYLWQACTVKGEAVWLSGREHDKYRKVDGRWWKTETVLETNFVTPYHEGWQKVKNIF